MDIKEKLNNSIETLRGLLKKYDKFSEEGKKEEDKKDEVKFVDAELEDGTKLNITPSIEMGAKVMVITDQGEVEAPNGTHKLTDGSSIVVEKGVIIEVIPAEQAAPAAQAASKENDEFKTQFAEAVNTIKTLTERVKSLEEKLADANKKSEAMRSQLDESKKIQKETFSIVEQLADMPATPPTEEKKIVNSKDERLEKISQAFKEIKKTVK